MLRNLFSILFCVALASVARADILIGVAGPMSGQFGILGNQMKAGVEAAAKSINAIGGINGEPLSVLTIDDGCDTRRAVEAAREFIAKDARAIIGHYCSGTSLAAALVYKDAGIPMITPSASAAQLTDARYWNVFRLALRDDALASIAAARIKSSGASQNPVFIGGALTSDPALPATLKAALPDIMQLDFATGPSTIINLQQSLTNRNPKSIIMGLPGAESARVVALLNEIGFGGQVYGSEALLSEDFTKTVGSPAFDILALLPADAAQNPNAKAAIDALRQESQNPDGAALPAYAATQMFIAAAKATSVNDGQALARWLSSGQGIDTALGTISFAANGDLKNPPATWYRWNGPAQRFLPE
jgi:branched-chain amino acid transport system substrate-binding protein